MSLDNSKRNAHISESEIRGVIGCELSRDTRKALEAEGKVKMRFVYGVGATLIDRASLLAWWLGMSATDRGVFRRTEKMNVILEEVRSLKSAIVDLRREISSLKQQ